MADTYLTWWTSIEVDLRKSLVINAMRDHGAMHSLIRNAFEAGLSSATPPSTSTAPEVFDAAFDEREFMRTYSKYGPKEAAREIWQAALASRPAEVDEWLPFDTAPRDGSTFLATNGQIVTSCRYINEPGYVREVRDMDGRYIDQEESDGFEGFMDDEGGLPDLTHWQPYPSAPSHTTDNEK